VNEDPSPLDKVDSAIEDSNVPSDSDVAAVRTARGSPGHSLWEVGFEGADDDPGIVFMRNNLAVLT
jgi:hypothetical protein